MTIEDPRKSRPIDREQHKRYNKEYKIEAVCLAEESDKPLTLIARELAV